MLDTVVRKLVEWRYERALRQFYLGNSVKVCERQLPDAVDAPTRASAGSSTCPATTTSTSTRRCPGNALTIGSQDPMIVFGLDAAASGSARASSAP